MLPSTTKVYQGELCEFYLHERILYIVANDQIISEGALVRDYGRIKHLLDGEKVYLLYDASQLQPITKKIRQMLEAYLEESFLALAVISKSRMGLIIANIFFGLSSSSFPKRIFIGEEEAIKWLNGITEQKLNA